MFVSTRGRYALRVMIDLAENQGDGYLPLKEIAPNKRHPLLHKTVSQLAAEVCGA